MFYLHIILCNVVLTKSPQSKKPARPTTTSSVFATTRMSSTQSASCVSAKSCTISVLAKGCESFRIISTPKTSTQSIRNSTCNSTAKGRSPKISQQKTQGRIIASYALRFCCYILFPIFSPMRTFVSMPSLLFARISSSTRRTSFLTQRITVEPPNSNRPFSCPRLKENPPCLW